jgi:hypothetical protein
VLCPPPNSRAQNPRGFSYPYFWIVNCSGSCTGSAGAAKADFALGTGDGGALGVGTATARGGAAVARASGVSEGLAEPFFFFGLGDFSGVGFFFFFPFGDASFAADFFGFGRGVASGVSLGLGDASDSSAGDFFAFGFFFGDGDGDSPFFFLCGDVFDFGVGAGDFSLDVESTA